jgi:glutaconyl-CoA/methylmalonyl-CoA decarboxylase subunit gamma
MRKFIISVSGEKFEVDVEEVSPDKVNTYIKTNSTRMGEYNQNVKGSLIPRKAGVVAIDSPMPGNIVRILVKPGDEVSTGQKLFVLESMKMENEIAAPSSGRVAGIKVNVGDAVSAGQNIMVLE